MTDSEDSHPAIQVQVYEHEKNYKIEDFDTGTECNIWVFFIDMVVEQTVRGKDSRDDCQGTHNDIALQQYRILGHL